MDRVYVDLDGPTVDFAGWMAESGLTGDVVKKMPGAYAAMSPVPGAIEAIRSLIGMGFDVHIATKPPTGISHAYAGKAEWVFKHLPELSRKLTLTHDKGQLGDRGDYLIDDRPHKANCMAFRGTLIVYGRVEVYVGGKLSKLLVGGNGTERIDWKIILDFFRSVKL